MKALAVIKDDRERRRIAKILGDARFEVSEAASVAAGCVYSGSDLAFVDIGGVAAMRNVAARMFLIAVVGANPSPSDFWTAYQAGADDVMRITASKEEIVGRAGALGRIRDWNRPSLTDRLSELSRALPLDEIIAAELGEMLGQRFSRTEFVPGEIAVAGDIALTLAAEHLQIRVGLGVENTALRVLQQVLLGGDANPEVAADALRELANTAGGAVKRAALGNGLDLTIGLPTNTNLTAVDRPGCRAWRLQSTEGMTFSCITLAASIAPKLVTARELREGMVLARDVRNPNGMLIASAGTNLTRTTVEKLSNLLATATFEISNAA